VTGIERFHNAEFDIETIQDGDSFRVMAPGLARGLGHADARDMIRSLPEDEKGSGLVPTPGGEQVVWFVTEPGFYRVLGQRQTARIKNAGTRAQVERFQRWIFHDVLPSLRKHGRYDLAGSEESIPATVTWDHAAAIGRARFGLGMSRNAWKQLLKSGGLLRLDGAPRQKYEDLFWPTETRWEIHSHSIRYLVDHALRTKRQLEVASQHAQLLIELGQIGREVEGPAAENFPF
jgi:prophage antirepressor-like protein